MPDIPPIQQQPIPMPADDVNPHSVPPIGPIFAPDDEAGIELLPGTDAPGTNPQPPPSSNGFPDHLPAGRQRFPRSL